MNVKIGDELFLSDGEGSLILRATPLIKDRTHADRIRSMSDEELAEWLCSIFECHYDTSMCAGGCNHNCEENHLDWLRQPAEEAMHAQ